MAEKLIWNARWYDWIAYWLVRFLPAGRWHMRLLPYAGRWEYRDQMRVELEQMKAEIARRLSAPFDTQR